MWPLNPCLPHVKLVFISDNEFDDVENKESYKAMLRRDERRFKTADKDGDGIATKVEFTAFLHPEEFDYMKDIVVQVRWRGDAELFQRPHILRDIFVLY